MVFKIVLLSRKKRLLGSLEKGRLQREKRVRKDGFNAEE